MVKRQMGAYRITAFGKELAGFGQVGNVLEPLSHLPLSCAEVRQMEKVWIWIFPPDHSCAGWRQMIQCSGAVMVMDLLGCVDLDLGSYLPNCIPD